MRLGLHCWNFSRPEDPAAIGPVLAQTARVAEEAGFSAFAVMDHFVQMDGSGSADEPMLEGYTTLGFVAGHTQRMTLGLLVTGVMYRYPGLLAKTATTLDVLSGGRARLGIGASWYEREQRGLGVPVYDAMVKTVAYVHPVLSDVDAFLEDVAAYAKLGVAEIQLMPDRHPVEFAEQVAQRIMPRL